MCLSVCLSVYLSVCLSVHLSVCVPVQVITFEPLKVGTSFLVHTHIFIMSRSSLSTKVIGSRSRSNDKNAHVFSMFCDLCVTRMVPFRLKSFSCFFYVYVSFIHGWPILINQFKNIYVCFCNHYHMLIISSI